MSRDEISAHHTNYGPAEIAGRKRKERCDKGKKRVNNDNSAKKNKGIDGNARPTRGKRSKASRQVPLSAEFVDTTSDDCSDLSAGSAY
jgi:hypothetical protein